ncbi:class I SAM-dependent methyltransferase [Streptosporangium sp. NPDC006930]|uniref:class I SAM-dependent methyltransferase n=1 Tax=Streptosporangium sp. NPDC006930 TaxID=3154783 RepID=UPI003428FDC2
MNDLLGRLRGLLLDTGYTIDGVRERLGDVAATALSREETVPALRATAEGDPLATLIRLWWLGVPVEARRVPTALPVEELAAAGLVAVEDGRVTSAVHLQPWDAADAADAGGYVVSDRKVRPGDPALRPDHVVGAGGASANLAQLASRRPVGRALDLGTGCGVQVLHLAGRAEEITATDVNPRALELARISWALSGITGVDARLGSLFDPVEDDRFDLVVSNPPFVISPAGRFTYRESGFHADDFCRDLVRRAPRHLAPGGTCHLLANWLHVDGEDWRDRVGGWLTGTGCDGWVVQRDVQDPAEYVELWLRDAAEQGTARHRELYDDWLGWFEAANVTGIGFGWITLKDSGSLDPVVRVEEYGGPVELPVGGHVDEVLGAIATAHRLSDAELLGSRLVVAEGVLEERIGPPGAEDPARIVLRQSGGLRRRAVVGTVEAALAGACDGDYPLDPLLAAIAELTGEDHDDLRAKAPAALRPLIAEGFFHISTG